MDRFRCLPVHPVQDARQDREPDRDRRERQVEHHPEMANCHRDRASRLTVAFLSLLTPRGGHIREKISVSAGQGTACGQSSWSGAVTRRVSAADLADLILITAREIQFRGYTDPRGIPLSQSEGMVTRHLQADPAPPPGCTAAATGAAAHQPVRRPARPRTQGSDRTPRQPRRPPRDDRPRDPSTDRPTILCDAGGRRDDPRHLAGRPAQHGLATARHTILARARSVAILSGRARPGTPAPRFSLRTRTWGSSGRRVSRIPASVP